jgi:hypothetical protein
MTLHNQQNAPSQLINTGDLAARDEHIRCLFYGVMRKLAGLPQDLSAGYWPDALGPLLARLPGVGCYVQHHFSQDHWANLWPLPEGVHRMNVVLDGAVGFQLTLALSAASERTLEEATLRKLKKHEGRGFMDGLTYNMYDRIVEP